MTQVFADAARAELAAPILATDTTFLIKEFGERFPVASVGEQTDAEGFRTAPGNWFKVVLQDKDDWEIVYVGVHEEDSNTFSGVLRGQDGTVAKAFPASTVVGIRPTAGNAADWEAKEDAIPLGSPNQFLAGDKVWKTIQIEQIEGLEEAISFVDNLVSTDAGKALSANQGRILKGFIDQINTLLQSDDATLDELQEIVDFIKLNRSDLDALSIPNIAGLEAALEAKQATLVSGSNIKTINGEDLLGPGDLVITPGGVIVSDSPPTDIKEGREWLDTTSGITYTWVNTGGQFQWVELSAGGAASSGVTSLDGQEGELTLKTIGGESIVGSGNIPFPPGVLSEYQEFTTSGTWEKPEGATWVYVEVIGGGGSGASSSGATTAALTGGTGGEGIRHLFRAEDLPSSISVIVGSGAPGVSGTSSGIDGGDSSFGSFITAYGGVGGIRSNSPMVSGKRAISSTNTGTAAGVMIQLINGIGVTQSISIYGIGGDCIYGAAAGSGIDSSNTLLPHGKSVFAGDGGSTKGGAGQFPGGGGAAGSDGVSSGAGADGCIRIWCW